MPTNDLPDREPTLAESVPGWVWPAMFLVIVLAVMAALFQSVARPHATLFDAGGVLLAVACAISIALTVVWWRVLTGAAIVIFGGLTVATGMLCYLTYR